MALTLRLSKLCRYPVAEVKLLFLLVLRIICHVEMGFGIISFSFRVGSWLCGFLYHVYRKQTFV